MRDLERWKDKVELSLDGRQIFFLFFGSAVAACVLFVSGMMVGKRIERRAIVSTSQGGAEDPLAALDQLATADDDDGLTFHQTLAAADHHAGRRDDKRVEAPKPEAPKPEALAAAVAKPDAAKPVAAKPDAAKPAAAKPVAAKPVAAKPVAAKPVAAKPVAAKPDAAKPVAAAAAKPEAQKPGKPAAPAQAAPAKQAQKAQKPAGKVEHFTLQLSAFPDKGEAEAFQKKMQTSGVKTFVVTSEVAGRGTFYRVRTGDFSTFAAASDALADVKRKQHVEAMVVKH